MRCKGCMQKFETLNERGLCPECQARENASGHKSPMIAAILSIIPGCGQYFYLGEKKKGNILLGITILFAGLGLFLFPFLILIPGGMLVSVLSARESAKRINEGVKI